MIESLTSLLNPAVKEFIRVHEHDDEKALLLKHSTIHGVPTVRIVEQINGRRKAKIKIPSFYKNDDIIYPPGINLEQCSSEATARFKASLVKGNTFADLTGGFSIDTFFIQRSFSRGFFVEPNGELLTIVKHNHHVLHCNAILYHNTTAENFLSERQEHFDLIFIDPSRRSETKQKVFKLSDCVPDVTQLLPQLFAHSNVVLIKTSPLLDLKQGLRELTSVERIIVLAVDNDCKEVLFLCRKDFKGEPVIEAVNLNKDDQADSFSFSFHDEREAEINFSDPLTYLYEPNASILKAGAFKSIGMKNKLAKIQASTHLYTSGELINDFPGRIFKIESLVKPEPKIVKQYFPDGKANITTRNYPLSPEQLKKKVGLTDGGTNYLIGFSGKDKKFLAVACRVK